ncbi:MAG: hypothetical protein KAX49_07205 [Halanaerobiales bacterium]|nr:hypothetical protein [Halanaerobiales bacterium]
MELYARFNSTDYKLENRPTLNVSSRETTFTNIKIDFTGEAIADLPIKYQEIQIVDTDEVPDAVLYTGYANKPKLPKFDGTVLNGKVLLEIEILSPQTYLSKRSIEIQIDNDNIHDAVEDILDSIVNDDGFTIEENTLPTDKNFSDIFVNESIEKILNLLSASFNFVWYVDENKGIYLRYIDDIIDEDAVLTVNSTTSNSYIKSIQPEIEAVDYGNRLNMKNVELIGGLTLIPASTALGNGEIYNFKYPFSISENVCYRIDTPFDDLVPGIAYALYLKTGTDTYKITIDFLNQTLTFDSEIGYLGEDDANGAKKILLQRDPSNTKLITGFKWNVASETTDAIFPVFTDTAIIPYNISYIDSNEISNSKDEINTSGIIERIIDVYRKYFTLDELTEYAKGIFQQNNKQTNRVTLEFQGDVNDSSFTTLKDALLLTKKVNIDLSALFIEKNNFIITDIKYSIDQNIGNLLIKTRSSNPNESYLDIFRKPTEQQIEDDLTRKAIIFYNQDEKTVMGHQVIVNGEVVNLV